MKILTILLGIFVLSGCAKTMLVHDYKTTADFNRDKYDCESDAARYAASLGDPMNFLIIQERQVECMTLKHGWKVAKAKPTPEPVEQVAVEKTQPKPPHPAKW